jgi:CHAT domain-containing protein
LLAAEPAAPGKSLLWSAEEEVLEVANALGRCMELVTFRGDSVGATVKNVIEHLPRVNIMHLACHGEQDSNNPLESGFWLRDGKLSVSQLMRLDLTNASLAFLSACETAMGDSAQPNQAVHLAATMLFVGFRSVIGTMWCVISPHNEFPVS